MRLSLGARHDFLRRYGVPEGWAASDLGSLARLVGGGTPNRDESRYWQGGTIPWATPTDLTANDSKFISRTAECITEAGLAESAATMLPIGSVLYTSRATIGAKAIAKVAMATNQGIASFVPTTIDGDFLFYLLDLLTPIIKRLGAGTTFDEVSKRDIRKISCAVPTSPVEQSAIARVLDAVDTVLERTRTAIARAAELGKSLLADLLSKGIGNDGNVRDPARSPHAFIRTRLGRLPAAWKLKTVGEEFEIQNGFTINEGRRATVRKRRYLRVANVQRDALDLSEVKELEAGDKEFAPRVLALDDLLVVEGHADRMQIGRCARVTEQAVGMTFQNHLFRLRTKGEITADFACLWLNSAYAQQFWNARCATSSGLNTINQRMLKRLVIPVVPTIEQGKITRVISQQRRHLESLVTKERCLAELKKSLMHDLLTGRVRVGANLLLAK